MIVRMLITILSLATFLTNVAYADYLEVSRRAIIRAAPDRDSPSLIVVETGEQLELLNDGLQTNGYYRVWQPAQNSDGWVYRNRVRRRSGALVVPIASQPRTVISRLHASHCLFGCPLGGREGNDLLFREIYLLSSNAETKFADWVAYVVRKENLGGSANRNWKIDPWLPVSRTLEPDDYIDANANLQVDRGHQAPLAAFQGTEHVQKTNYLSNITPQKSALNQGPWKRLEDSVRKAALQSPVFVVTGPVFDRKMPVLPRSDKSHRIPSGYWKIIAIEGPGGLNAVAFLMDQLTARSADLLSHLVTIDEIETKTGLDFLWMLEDSTEEHLERSRNEAWAREVLGTE